MTLARAYGQHMNLFVAQYAHTKLILTSFFFFIFLPSFSEHLNHSEHNNGTSTALRWTKKNKQKTNPTSFKCRLRTVMKNILLPLEFVYVMQLSETLKGFPLSSGFFVTSLFFSHSLASCRSQCQTNKNPTKECGALWIFTVEKEAPQKMSYSTMRQINLKCKTKTQNEWSKRKWNNK